METKQGTLQEEPNPRKVSKHSLKLELKYSTMKHGISFQTFRRTSTSRPEVRIYGAKFNKRGRMTSLTDGRGQYVSNRRGNK